MDFAGLYTRYAQGVFRFAFFLCGQRELAEGIAAETFARALTTTARVQPGSLKAYLFAIARNLFLDWTRTQGRTTLLTDEELDAADFAPGPDLLATGRHDAGACSVVR